jgi:hypothetical protein
MVDDTLKSLVALVAVGVAALRPSVITAQSLEPLPVACKGQIVSRIEVHTRPPFEIGGSKMQQRLARQITALHATTNPEIIRRFLALVPGEPCTALRRSESERILRAQPYLADAVVQAFPDDNGMVWISVVTVDEISLMLGGGGSGKSPYLRGFKIGEGNFMGEAISLDGKWRYNADFPDEIAGRMTDYQLLGKPFQLSIGVARRENGEAWDVEASHPFLTDLQNLSWRSTAGSSDGLARFRRPDGTSVFLPFSRDYGDLGGVGRIGHPGHVALIGGSISYEREAPGESPMILQFPERRLIDEPGTPVAGRYQSHLTTRLNALLGLRLVRFVQATGFETLDGVQDMREGIEIASVIGTGIMGLGSAEHDRFVSGDVYAGVGSSQFFSAVEVLAEGRHPENGDQWDGILASGRWAAYLKPASNNTIVADAEWSAGWKQRVPFQLSLADKEGGPLGYRRYTLAGGRRLVTRLEDRIFLGRLKQFVSLGIAPVVNTGELWAGDAPYGTNTGVKYSAGISILASVPPQSQRLWRLDIVFPIHPDNGAKWMFRLSSHNFTRMFWKEPNDVSRNRERSIPTTIFNWP